MRTQTISYLKKHAANLPLEEPLVITQNGVPSFVVESFEARQKRDEAIALMKLLSFSTREVEDGQVVSSDELKQSLAHRNKEE